MKKRFVEITLTVFLSLTVFCRAGADWKDKYSDLESKTPAELRLLRNEIYARHGRQFKSADLRKYFSKQPWYKPDPQFKGSRLSEEERELAYKILKIEQAGKIKKTEAAAVKKPVKVQKPKPVEKPVPVKKEGKKAEVKEKKTASAKKEQSVRPVAVKEEEPAVHVEPIFKKFVPLLNIREIDLNGDGKKDAIEVKREKGESKNTYALYINGKEVLEGLGQSDYSVVDIDTGDRYREVAFLGWSESEGNVTSFYYYTGRKAVKMGEVPGKLVRDITVNGSGVIRKEINCQVLTARPLPEKYMLTKDRLIRRVSYRDGLYEMNYGVTVREKLPLVKSRTNPELQVFLKPGEKVRILATDNEKWVLVRNSEGVEGWFAVENFWLIKSLKKIAPKVFSGLYPAEQWIDMDTDGVKEAVCFQRISPAAVKIHINNRSIIEGGSGCDWKIINIASGDGLLEIAVGDRGLSGETSTRVYCYKNGEIVRVGTVEGAMPEDLIVNGSGTVVAGGDSYRLDSYHNLTLQ